MPQINIIFSNVNLASCSMCVVVRALTYEQFSMASFYVASFICHPYTAYSKFSMTTFYAAIIAKWSNAQQNERSDVSLLTNYIKCSNSSVWKVFQNEIILAGERYNITEASYIRKIFFHHKFLQFLWQRYSQTHVARMVVLAGKCPFVTIVPIVSILCVVQCKAHQTSPA